MYAGTYIIIVRKSGADDTKNWYCLGTKVIEDPTTHNSVTIGCVSKFDPETDVGDNTWLVAPVPGTDSYSGFFLQHQKTSLVACFGNSSYIQLEKFKAAHMEYLMRLNHVGNGWVTINDHSNDLVMDAMNETSKIPFLGQPVFPNRWNSSANQEWRFINTALFTGTPL